MITNVAGAGMNVYLPLHSFILLWPLAKELKLTSYQPWSHKYTSMQPGENEWALRVILHSQ